MPSWVSVLALRPKGAMVPRAPDFPVAKLTPAALAASPAALVNSITVLPERSLVATLAPLNADKVILSAVSKPRVLNFRIGGTVTVAADVSTLTCVRVLRAAEPVATVLTLSATSDCTTFSIFAMSSRAASALAAPLWALSLSKVLALDSWLAAAETRLLTDVELPTAEAVAAWVRMLLTVLLLPRFRALGLV